MRYDTILASLEQGVFPSFQRRFSIEDDGGYFSGNRIRGTHFSLSLSLFLSVINVHMCRLEVPLCFCVCPFIDNINNLW